MSHTHTHRVVGIVVRPFTGPVAGARRPDRRAHGAITETERCRCGATRESNRNQGHVERGPWRLPNEGAAR